MNGIDLVDLATLSLLRKLRRENRALKKVAEAAAEMYAACPTDSDATPRYDRATTAYEVAVNEAARVLRPKKAKKK